MQSLIRWVKGILAMMRNSVINAFVITIVLFVSLLLLAPYFNKPPVDIKTLDPEHLGVLCPGQELPIHNLVTIPKQVIAIYYVSILDESGLANIPGHQETFSGFTHPNPGTFTQVLPWTVPRLPPGLYNRSFAGRGTDGTEESAYVTASFMIGKTGDDCR